MLLRGLNETLMQERGNSRYVLNQYNVILATCLTFCGIFLCSIIPLRHILLVKVARLLIRYGQQLREREISVSSALLEKLPKQSELFCVLESVVEVPGGHIRHSSCALNSWYDPIGQSLHFPVALSK